MSYSSIPKFDVSIQRTQRGVACVLCSFGDLLESTYVAESTEEMVGHVRAHERKGDLIPPTITDDLWRDDTINYPQGSSGLV